MCGEVVEDDPRTLLKIWMARSGHNSQISSATLRGELPPKHDNLQEYELNGMLTAAQLARQQLSPKVRCRLHRFLLTVLLYSPSQPGVGSFETSAP